MTTENIIFPTPDETAYETARLIFIRHAVDSVAALSLGDSHDAEQNLSQLAKETPPGARFVSQPAFKALILSELSSNLPSDQLSHHRRIPAFKRTQNWHFLDLIAEPTLQIPSQTMPRDAELISERKKVLRRAAIARGVDQLRLVRPGAEEGTLTWKSGVIGAAALFAADITNPTSLKVYKQLPRIRENIRGYTEIAPRRKSANSPTIYETIGSRVSKSAMILDHKPTDPHKAFWEEMKRDLNRFEERQALPNR